MNMTKAIVGFSGSMAVAFAIYVTGSALPLWALFIVAGMIESCGDSKDKKDKD